MRYCLEIDIQCQSGLSIKFDMVYTYSMKQSNNKVSQHKIKRAAKNQKRKASKPQLSKFERRQELLRSQLTDQFKLKPNSAI